MINTIEDLQNQKLFFETINKMDKPLARKKEKEKTQITKSLNKSGNIAIDLREMKSIVRKYCEPTECQQIR